MAAYIDSGVILTGGSANLEGIVELAERIFELPVRIGRPGQIQNGQLRGMREMIEHPEYATCVGLVLHGARAVSVKPFYDKQGFFKGVVNRVSSWFVEHF